MSRGLAFLFGAGAALVAVSLLLPHSSNTNEPALLIAAGAAFLTAAGLVRLAERTPVRALQVVLALGTVLITVCVIYGGDSATAYPLMYVWVALYAAYVFTPRAALMQTAAAAGACAAAFLIENDTRAPSVHWLMGAGTIVVAAVLTASLTRRLRAQQADLGTVARMANGLADLSGFAQVTCANLRASARCDAVVFLEPLPDADGLVATASSGSAETARLFDGGEIGRQVSLALASGRPQTLLDSAGGNRPMGEVLSATPSRSCATATRPGSSRSQNAPAAQRAGARRDGGAAVRRRGERRDGARRATHARPPAPRDRHQRQHRPGADCRQVRDRPGTRRRGRARDRRHAAPRAPAHHRSADRCHRGSGRSAPWGPRTGVPGRGLDEIRSERDGRRPSSEPTPQRLAAIREQLTLLADYL